MVVGFIRRSWLDAIAWFAICCFSAASFGLNLDLTMEINMILHVATECVVQFAALRELVDR